MSDTLLSAGATAVMVVWSLLAHDSRASMAGLGIALWFPISVVLYRAALRWLPMIGGIRAGPPAATAQRRREITASCLLTSSLCIIFLASMPPGVAVADAIALNFACLAALLDYMEGWMPTYVLVPMMLAGLVSNVLHDSANAAILGAAAAWVAVSLALTFMSISLRANFLSGGDITMATACGAWVGSTHLSTFLLLSALLHWASCVVMRALNIPPPRHVYLDGPERTWARPMGPSFAMGLTLTLLVQACPALPGWVQALTGH
ncbi:prepilin peptidase [Acetobacter sp. TBRC 12305]|uniref:Prepilin peptidase n=1 Tax=Acetobacter garciniae TaxID=2817435 RepID=A0A939KLZ8_9PROT|nr:prepilin peptidase [Acetobacter garciniae]MBO1324758.1 prepilin peptidase [Acetobacter garciniae]MBX0344449.1 prepilin peptidase [Acetobacter garciniae]